jgi:hypothetical protein
MIGRCGTDLIILETVDLEEIVTGIGIDTQVDTV